MPVRGTGIPERNTTLTLADVTESSHADPRDALRAYLIRYALWAVCGEGEKPDPPIGFNTDVETAPRLRDVGV